MNAINVIKIISSIEDLFDCEYDTKLSIIKFNKPIEPKKMIYLRKFLIFLGIYPRQIIVESPLCEMKKRYKV